MSPVQLLLWLLAAAPAEPLVEVSHVIPDVVVDLRYATDDNFMKKQVYPEGARCLLLQSTVERLQGAADALRKQGYRLRLYDCYRPSSVQYELWKVSPRPGYVMDPKVGSNHSRGGSVDLSLVTLEGGEVEMPSAFDVFGKPAHHSYQGASKAALEHRSTLRAAMEAAGFNPNPLEWWHYDVPNPWHLPLLDVPMTAAPSAPPAQK
jgi:D-alanyl-D-alanine dipeptidase